jgi:tripartite ATP-independent transporter DctP family solute receptor
MAEIAEYEENVMKSVTRRNVLATATGFGLAAGLAPVARAQSPITLRVSSGMPTDRTAAHFAFFEPFNAKVKAAFGERIHLDYYPNNQLGSEADVVQQVKVGAVDMMITGSSIWATVAPELGVLDLGYMFDSFDHLTRALDGGGMGKNLADIVYKRTNVTILGWGFNFGARNVYTKASVTSLAELKNTKLRVLPTNAFIQTFKLMGAVPTPIPVNELYTALQTGVVDGFEHDAGTALAQKFYEVANHGFLTEHLFGPMLAAIGHRGLEKIPADIRPAFLKVATEAMLDQRVSALERSKEAMEELKRRGVVYAPMPPNERKAMQTLMAEQLYAPFADQYPETKAIFATVAATRGA